jgi:hypothetical protein
MQDKTIRTELNKVLSAPAVTSSSEAGQVMAVVVPNPSTTGGDGASGNNIPSSASQNSLTDAVALSTAQLAQVRSAVESQLALLTENTRALSENTTAKSVGSAATNVAGSMLNTILGGGLLAPVISGLMSLFGGDKQSESVTPLVKFALPSPVPFNAGVQGGASSGVDYGQNDQPRLAASSAASPAQQITVNVTAMDSRSFLDHSSEIASAVRRAILESSSLNDVIGEM